MPKTPSWSRPAPRSTHGVTLIEIMVAIAIVGILFRIALPVYQSQVLKTKRYAAQSCLMEYAQYMERYYTTNTSNPMSYTGVTVPTYACETSLTSAYTFVKPSTVTSSTYILIAQAKNLQTQDTGCTSLGLAQDGTRSPATCWP